MKASRYIAGAAIVLLCLGSAAGAKDGFDTIVETKYGTVEGRVIEDFETVVWKGIPYAAPPVGAARWKAPGDPQPWSGVRDAGDYGNRCYQRRRGEEDCLYLNVWRPNRKDRTNLPVFVYIHGGSNTGGSGEGSWYTVAHHYDAVVVTLNYRLGAMGWFYHPALRTGDPIDDSGNLGTLDQIKALQWVQQNIARFGGDPKNVTLAGASAGAQNVSYLMHTALAKDLFHKALLESNFPGIRPVSAATKSSKQVLYNLLVADGVAADSAAAKTHVETGMSDQDIVDYFHGKTAKEITDVYSNAYWGGINWGDFYRDDIVAGSNFTPPPVVQASEDRPEFVYCIGDGHVLPDDLSFADFSKGHVFPKPAVIGTTKNENNFWNADWPFNFQQGKSLDTLITEAVTNSNPAYGYLAEFYSKFGSTNDEFMENYLFGTELIDEVDTYLGAQLSARNLARARRSFRDDDDDDDDSGARRWSKVPIYVYRFDWGSDPEKDYRIPFEDAWVFYKGAVHVAEADFFYQRFFGLADGGSVTRYQYSDENLAGRKALSLATKAYLRAFIHHPKGKINNKPGQPVAWLPWTAKNERFIVFDADHASADVHMNDSDITRTPEELFAAHAAHPNETVRDFIEYYIMWSWHWNWYPNASVDPFDTAPGPNSLFDPANP